MKHIRVRIPQECHLWTHKDLSASELRAALSEVKVYEDESHLIRKLLRCNQCRQLYFHEFYEIVDWENGNDAQYSSWIPVEDAESADALSALLPVELLRYSSLRIDYPSNADKPSAPHWTL